MAITVGTSAITFNDSTTQSTAAVAGLTSAVAVCNFTSSGTWTKPSGAKLVTIELWGAGGGGASGAKNNSGISSGTIIPGGGGGGGGGYNLKILPAACVSCSVTVTVGSGGPGGAARTSATASTNYGCNGGNSSFGCYIKSYGGGGGAYRRRARARSRGDLRSSY